MPDLEQLRRSVELEFVCLANELFNILLLEKIIAVLTQQSKINSFEWRVLCRFHELMRCY